MKPKQDKIKNLLRDLTPPLIRQKAQPKHHNILCIGMPKSGTTSIANLFSNGYRYEHEGERFKHVHKISSHHLKTISDSQYQKYLLGRAHRLWLDIESNCFLGYRPDIVYRAFPDAKYILTIREPYSWLNSIFDNNINFPVTKGYTEKLWHEFFFKPTHYKFPDEELILKESNLYPIDAYLNYWVNANKSAIDSIPSSQLLILNTNQISNKLTSIANFVGIKKDSLNKNRTRMNITEKKHNIIDLLDQRYVKNKIEKICGQFINTSSLKF